VTAIARGSLMAMEHGGMRIALSRHHLIRHPMHKPSGLSGVRWTAWAYCAVAAVVLLVGTVVVEAEMCRVAHTSQTTCDLVPDLFYWICAVAAVLFSALATAFWWQETFGPDH
jgi:hypothetical protein